MNISKSYIELIDQHWRTTIHKCAVGGANKLQLQCLHNLAETEFGRKSDMRLRLECFWVSKVDQDGDVILLFIEPYEIVNDKGVEGKRVSVCIDHAAIITIKDLGTQVESVFNPHNQYLRGVQNSGLVWMLEDALLKPFTTPSFIFYRQYCATDESFLTSRECLVIETGHIFSPMLFGRQTSEIRGQVDPDFTYLGSGYASHRNKTYLFQSVYSDEVCSEHIFSLRKLTVFQRVKALYNRAVPYRVEKLYHRFFNWTPGKPNFQMYRFKDAGLGDIAAYCIF